MKALILVALLALAPIHHAHADAATEDQVLQLMNAGQINSTQARAILESVQEDTDDASKDSNTVTPYDNEGGD